MASDIWKKDRERDRDVEHLLINVLEQVFREIHKTENSKIKTGFILHSINIFPTIHLDAECMFGWHRHLIFSPSIVAFASNYENISNSNIYYLSLYYLEQ